MVRILKNYAGTLALLAGIIIGGVCGVLFKEGAHAVKPVGDIFLNMLFMLIVPLVFFSISCSFVNLRKSRMIGRVLASIVVVFFGMSIIAAILTYFGTLVYNPLQGVDKASILGSLPPYTPGKGLSAADAIVSSLTVPDFVGLFSKANLLPLIVFSALFGTAVSMTGDKGKPLADLLVAGNEAIMKMMNIVMYLAPVGLGCYFADTVATIGSQILGGYLRAFVLYTALAAVFFCVVSSAYVLAFTGISGLRAYWRDILPPSVTALATSSSAAAMPGNIEAAKKMGVNPDIAESVIPLGTNIHKDGSVISAVVKVVFVMALFSQNTVGVGPCLTIVGLSILSAIVTGAVPSGAMTGELLICSLLGLDPQMVGILMIISTIVDIPATLINSSSNVVAAVIVDRLNQNKTQA